MNYGFIGAGNMAGAIFLGALKKGCISSDQVYLYDVDDKKMYDYKEKYSIHACASLEILIAKSDILLLCVKPNIARMVLEKITIEQKALVSIVAGLSTKTILGYPGVKHARILRIMPNTPLMIGEGASVFASNTTLLEAELNAVKTLFCALGIVEFADEKLFDAVTGINGSGPAYVYLFIDALSDAGVKHGLSRDVATKLAAQTALGASKMVLETGMHPSALKDQVCSPGGTTIEAVAALEKNGFRNAIISAVDACVEKSKKL